MRRGPRRERRPAKRGLPLGQRVVLLELRLGGWRLDSLQLGFERWSPMGRVVDPPTPACPFVTVRMDDGELLTLLRGNLRRVEERDASVAHLVEELENLEKTG